MANGRGLAPTALEIQQQIVPIEIVADPSLASQATTSETSSGVMNSCSPFLPSWLTGLYGIGAKLCRKLGHFPKTSIIASFSTIGVSIEYGWIELTRMPNSPTSIASALVSATRPCLEAE